MNHNEMFEYLKVVSRMERQFYTAFGRDITSERIITMSKSISGLVKVLIDFKETKDFPISIINSIEKLVSKMRKDLVSIT